MSLFGNDTITIIRKGQPDANLNRTVTTIYSGPADFQIDKGEQFVDAAGAVHTAAAVCFIGPLPTGSALPVVNEDDVVQYGGAEYVVMLPKPMWALQPVAHVELLLKRGPQHFREGRL